MQHEPAELRLVLLGAPGAGKGTQAQRIAKACALPHISTGDMFRAQVESGTELGRTVQRLLAEGSLVPDEIAAQMLEQRLAEPDAVRGFILDGFPRTRAQAAMLDAILTRRGTRLDLVLDLEVPDQEIVERLCARRVCPECGAIYNMKFEPPRRDALCDRVERHGDVRLIQREDDTEDVIRQRLKVYHERTEPLIAFYRGQGLLEAIDASGAGPEEVYDRIRGILSRKGAPTPP